MGEGRGGEGKMESARKNKGGRSRMKAAAISCVSTYSYCGKTQ